MEPIIGLAQDGAPPPADLIKDSDTARFVQDVIDVSKDTPVIVDFWAPWCGPCKQLGPALEKAVTAAGGKVKLVKINVDENQELAGQMRVQSIPAVFAFKNGQPVDAFKGALPESQIKDFIKKLAGPDVGDSPVDEALSQADDAQQAGDLTTAQAIYAQVVRHEPENEKGLAGLLRCLIADGRSDEARTMLSELTEAVAALPKIAAVKTALDLAEESADAGEIQNLEAKVAADPNDHQARYDLSTAYYADGRREDAVEALLELIRRDRAWNEQAGRKQLVKLFEAFGHADPLTVSARKRLSSLLFS